MKIDPQHIQPLIALALKEDIGTGDLSAQLIDPDQMAQAQVIAKEPAVICGRPWFDQTFLTLDPDLHIQWHVEEGQTVAAGTRLVSLHGKARALLSGERCALNFLQTLSGTATLTRRYVEALDDSTTRLLDTRKTLPGLRLAQKYAVRCGGGHNHRMGLYDMIMLKENHIAAAGSITAAVSKARRLFPETPIEVETETLAEVQEALEAGADIIMLDDFTPEMMQAAITQVNKRAKLEISGNVTIETLPTLAALGVDYISTGAITKHIQAIDLSMRIDHE